MQAKISSVIDTESSILWDELQKTSTLISISFPIIKFKPQAGFSIPKRLNIGEEYKLKLFFLGIIPLGKHVIKLVEIHTQEKRMITQEYGTLAKTWNHTITLKPEDKLIHYTDHIEIKAGILTFSIWLFSCLFYRHRQRKLKKILRKNI